MNAALSPLSMPFLAPRAAGRARITLGTMNFGKRTDAAVSERIMARAVERGIVLFDTANVYNDGESERIVGRALQGRRESIIVATKVGLARASGRPEGLSRAAIERALGASLDRLGTDYVDLYYLHAPDAATPIEETIDAIAEQMRAGKIRHLGVSNYASWQIFEIMKLCDERGIARPEVSQVMYNVLIRQIEIEYLRFAQRYPIHTTVYNPLAGGLLAGHYRFGPHPGLRPAEPGYAPGPSDEIAAGSRFDKNALYQRRYWSPRLFEQVEQYRALAEAEGMTLLDFAYAWLAEAKGVDSILVGPATLEHLDAAISACERNLSADARAKAAEIHRTFAGTDASYAR